MKYALACLCDQTHAYYSENGWTLKHPEVKLFDDIEEARTVMKSEFNGDLLAQKEQNVDISHYVTLDDYWIEDVPDENEFRSRKDTW